MFRPVQTSAAISLPFQSKDDLPNDEFNPPAEGQIASGAVRLGSGEITMECCLEEAFFKGQCDRLEEGTSSQQIPSETHTL